MKFNREHAEFLGLIIHQDAASNTQQAVEWCIDSCMKIEAKYGVDACYVAHNNIVHETLLKAETEGEKLFYVKFYGTPTTQAIYATNFTTAGILAMAYNVLTKAGWGIEYIESSETGNRVPFEL